MAPTSVFSRFFQVLCGLWFWYGARASILPQQTASAVHSSVTPAPILTVFIPILHYATMFWRAVLRLVHIPWRATPRVWRSFLTRIDRHSRDEQFELEEQRENGAHSDSISTLPGFSRISGAYSTPHTWSHIRNPRNLTLAGAWNILGRFSSRTSERSSLLPQHVETTDDEANDSDVTRVNSQEPKVVFPIPADTGEETISIEVEDAEEEDVASTEEEEEEEEEESEPPVDDSMPFYDADSESSSDGSATGISGAVESTPERDPLEIRNPWYQSPQLITRDTFSREEATPPHPYAYTSSSCDLPSNIWYRGRQLILQETLGVGGFGRVMRATDGHSVYAVKVMNVDRAVARTSRESAAYSMLTEIGTMKDSYYSGCRFLLGISDDGALFKGRNVLIVMNYCPLTLDDYVNLCPGGVPLDETRVYAAQILSGLLELYHLDIMHCDLKLTNILIRPDGNIVISDFGVSLTNNPEHVATRDCLSADVAGTQGYWSPEVDRICRGNARKRNMGFDLKRAYNTVKADTWSYGMCVYLMLRGYGERDKAAPLFFERYLDRFVRKAIDVVVEDDSARDFLRKVLDTRESTRTPFIDMYDHEFVKPVWEGIHTGDIMPLFVPRSDQYNNYRRELELEDKYEPRPEDIADARVGGTMVLSALMVWGVQCHDINFEPIQPDFPIS